MNVADQRRVINITGAAIVCSHIAIDSYPILLAIRDEPISPEDSGWQFLCNSGADENQNLAQVWALSEVMEAEPTLKEILSQPPGSKFTRKDRNSPWVAAK
jgi:hypothetical protein